MATRRSPQEKFVSTPTSRSTYFLRKYPLRHSPLSARRVSTRSDEYRPFEHPAARPVLVPLQPNLRRLPSRLMTLPKGGRGRALRSLVPSVDFTVGTKRKRVASGNENVYFGARGGQADGRFKRQRSINDKDDTSDEDGFSSHSEMDVDEENKYDWESDHTEAEENELDDSDEFLLQEAEPRQLIRLRKDELIRLFDLAGLSGSAEELTKSDLVDAIISARDEDGEIPPSSPPGPSNGHSSGYSSDDGNDGGDESAGVADPLRFSLRRRVTVQDLNKPVARPLKGRSFSMPQGPINGCSLKQKVARFAQDVASPAHHLVNGATRRDLRNGSSTHSSPSVSNAALLSPPAKRLRSRTLSETGSISSATSSLTSTSSQTSDKGSPTPSSKRKGKAKQVGFVNPPVQIDDLEESDLTDLPESYDDSRVKVIRRTRSKAKLAPSPPQAARLDTETSGRPRRITRRSKGMMSSVKEESDQEEESSGEEGEEEEEVDQLMSSPSPSPATSKAAKKRPVPRSPIKKRLRPRRATAEAASSDGDDEEEEDVSEDSQPDESVASESEEESQVEVDEEYVDSEVDKEEVPVEPRRLRNGKVVGEDIVEMEEDEEDETAEEGSDTSVAEASPAEEEESMEEADDGEEEDEAMEDDIDLSVATKKTLIRLRRDDLVRLCEVRELDVEGTKAQLAQGLLEWRDRQENDSTTSAPSSAATIRPPSATVKNGDRTNGHARKGKKSQSSTPPVLLRSHRFHMDEPVTPPVDDDKKENDVEAELDLESLGLEDREIPPDKITKLEKIGSGGFKDVFIGKFKGRKVAISEFRDQLSPMDIKELKLLAEFTHPNIVRFLGVSIPENTRETPVMIISELCSNGDLFDYVRNVQAPTLYKALNIMLDIARGLQYLHEHKPSVIHRDCKSSNILITSKGTAKIADFGLAKVKQSTRSMVRSLVGTVNWQAPELWHAHPKYNHKVDVYSCACVYWEMLQWHNPNKKFPWEGMNEHAIYEAVGAKRQRPSLSGLRKLWCPEIVELIERMWAQDHQDRPGIAEVVEELQSIIRTCR